MSLLATTEKAPVARASLRRRVWSWLGIAAAILVIGSLLATLRFDYTEPEPFSLDSPRYDGTRALAALLERQGTDVTEAGSADEARNAGPHDVLVVTDATSLDPATLRQLAERAARLVILRADYVALDEFFPGIGFGGSGHGSPVTPACDMPEAAHAGEIIPGEAYSVTNGTGCYSVGDGFALISAENVVAFDGSAIVTNEHLAEAGHAALALGLPGETGSVVWYSPSGADLVGGAETLGDLVPTWVTPAIVLAAIVAGAAAVWRGRRFGPLVAENLPVTVRASETLEGRARLYRDGLDPAHAYSAIRRGAIGRMSKRLGLSPEASADELSTAIAAATRRDPHDVRAVLLTDPTTDTHLADLCAQLRKIETDLDDSNPWEGRSR